MYISLPRNNTMSATSSNNNDGACWFDQRTIDWLLEGDVSIQYQVHRDLLDDRLDGCGEKKSDDTLMKRLRQRISTEGWGKQLLDAYHPTIGHWGEGFYQPKWISSLYTLLDLRHLGMDASSTATADAAMVIPKTIHKILKEEKSEIDGGVDCHSGTQSHSDVCVNGMFLYYACYFMDPNDIESDLHSVIDFILSQQMPSDGGFNCCSNRSRPKPKSSSVHTTISLLEGFIEYEKQQYTYRLQDIRKASNEAWEFLLRHQLYLSIHKNPGQVINTKFLKFPFPCRWYYDVLRALDYWQYANLPWDDRLQPAIDVLVSKQSKKNDNNKWNLNSKHPGQIHFEMEKAGRKPSRWNTLRALRVLKHYHNTKQNHMPLATNGTISRKRKR